MIVRVKPGINCVVTLPDGRQCPMVEDMPFDDRDELLLSAIKASGTKLSDWCTSDPDEIPARKRGRRVETASREELT